MSKMAIQLLHSVLLAIGTALAAWLLTLTPESFGSTSFGVILAAIAGVLSRIIGAFLNKLASPPPAPTSIR